MQKIVLLGLVVLLAVSFSSTTSYSIVYHPPPLQQMLSGIMPSSITCTEGLSIVFKATTQKAACVSASTAEKLALRGWSMPPIYSFEDCAKAGNPVMESFPRQCITLAGEYFVEDEKPVVVNHIITEIIDGDTVKIDGKSVRFALASAPELFEPGGIQAKQFISNLCPPGTLATIDEDDKQPEGSYNRIIAVIYCNGKNLNSELLDAGLGTLSTQFCNISEFAGETWAQKHGCNIQKTSEHAVTQQVNCDPSYPDVCIAPYPPDLDCGEIFYNNFRVTGPDPHGFDGDNDGIGCEK